MYLLDWDHCYAYLDDTHPSHESVRRSFDHRRLEGQTLHVSAFTAATLAEFPHCTQTAAAETRFRDVLQQFYALVVQLPLSPAVIEQFGRMRHRLRIANHPLLSTMDSLHLGTAATAIALDLTMVSHVPEHQELQQVFSLLRLECWF